MNFVIILISIALERFINCGRYFARFAWFDAYLKRLHSLTSKTNLWQGVIGFLIALLPPVIIVAIVYFLFSQILYGLIGYLIALAVLIYCLGPEDIFAKFQAYLTINKVTPVDAASTATKSKAKAETEPATKTDESQKSQGDNLDLTPIEHLIIDKPEHASELKRSITSSIFFNYNQAIFAVAFWFVVLGPIGAVLYRITALIKQAAFKSGSHHAQLAQPAKCFLDILDWIPVRLLGLGYALVGDFSACFNFWLRHVLTSIKMNKEFIIRSGLVALDVDATDASTATLNENRSALELVERTTILYLVVFALIILGTLL